MTANAERSASVVLTVRPTRFAATEFACPTAWEQHARRAITATQTEFVLTRDRTERAGYPAAPRRIAARRKCATKAAVCPRASESAAVITPFARLIGFAGSRNAAGRVRRPQSAVPVRCAETMRACRAPIAQPTTTLPTMVAHAMMPTAAPRVMRTFPASARAARPSPAAQPGPTASLCAATPAMRVVRQ